MDIRKISTANSKPFTDHIGIGKEQAKRLASIKRENALRNGYDVPVAHMAGSFGFK